MGTAAGRRARLLLAAAVSVPLLSLPAGAAPGQLDPAFGRQGKTTTDLGGDEQAQAVAVTAQGLIVTAGYGPGCARRYQPASAPPCDSRASDFAVARYRPDGTLDPGFGGGRTPGTATADLAGQLDEARAVAVMPDGRIVAGGLGYVGSADFALVRLFPDGRLDPTFGDGGRVTTDFGADESVGGVAVAPDGSIVAAGCTRCQKPDSDFALARYRPDGTLDPGFGLDGKLVTDFYDGTDAASAVAFTSGGLIVAAGFAAGPEPTRTDNRQTDFAVARYNPNGVLDLMFGRDGKATVDYNNDNDDAAAMTLGPDGSILMAGFAAVRGNFDFALVRLDPAGAPDPAFGTGGKVSTDFDGGNEQAAGLVVLGDGKIVAAGNVQTAKGFDFALVRYLPGGAVDPTFGTGGKVSTDFAGSDDAATGVVLAGGRVVPAGFTNTSSGNDFALAAYSLDLEIPALTP